jgi:hypothetical protein
VAKHRRATEDEDYVTMVERMIRALERRAEENPAILPRVIRAAQRLSDVPDVVIARCAVRYAQDPYSSPSAGEIARLLEMKKQSVSERRKRGDRVIFERQMGQDTLTQREREARTRAAQHADTTLESWLTRRAERLGS